MYISIVYHGRKEKVCKQWLIHAWKTEKELVKIIFFCQHMTGKFGHVIKVLVT